MGNRGRLYDEAGDLADGKALLARSDGDSHHFVSSSPPRTATRLPELKPMIRDLMRRMEEDLGVKLDWVAVDHFNTGHPHTHVVLRGREKSGQDLILARQYISHGIRSRVQELVTLELGPETDLERLRKLVNEVGQERLTRLDRSLLAQPRTTSWPSRPSTSKIRAAHAMRMGRLKTLERLGLAEERQRGVWVLDAMLEGKLRQLGDRADKLKRCSVLCTRPASSGNPACWPCSSVATARCRWSGGLSASASSMRLPTRQYVVVGRLPTAASTTRARAPQRRCRAAARHDRQARRRSLEGRPQASSRIEVLSPANLRGQETYLGPTWLDELISGKERLPRLSSGFGSEVERALAIRVRWLTERQLAVRSVEGQVSLKPDALATLRRHETERLAGDLTRHYGAPFAPAVPGVSFSGVYDRSIVDPPPPSSPIIRTDTSVTVAPWRPALEPMRGQRVPRHYAFNARRVDLERGRGLVHVEVAARSPV